jgi:hypothetical protein
MPATAETMVN